MTVTFEMLKDELDNVSSEVLAHIHYCQYELTGQRIMDVIDEIIWERFSVAGGTWPMSEPIADEDFGQPYKFQTVMYCASAAGPEDPAHQVARSLNIEIGQRFFGGPNGGFLCSCGQRMSYKNCRTRRVSNGWDSHVWPRTIVAGVVHFAVCKHAPTPFDLGHAPRFAMRRCLCDEKYLEEEAKLWPAQ